MANYSMKRTDIESLYYTLQEAAEYLGVSKPRIYQLRDAGLIKELKGKVYEAASVRDYKDRRGDKKGGRYPSEQ